MLQTYSFLARATRTDLASLCQEIASSPSEGFLAQSLWRERQEKALCSGTFKTSSAFARNNRTPAANAHAPSSVRAVVARSTGRRAGAIGLGAAELSPERDSEQLLIAVVGCGVFVATANAHNHRAVCLGRADARPVLCDIA